MHRIRQQFGEEVEELYPVLHETYRLIGVFQKNRTPRNEARLLEQLAIIGPMLDFFRPYIQGRKQNYFKALLDEKLPISDRIVALDIAVGAMHIEFAVPRAYMHQESQRLREVLEASRRAEDNISIKEGDLPSGVLVQGIPASPGVAVGKAFIVRKNSDYRHLPSGGIIVTQMTRPELIFGMDRAAGVVTDVGGSLCHAAIIARELGIPCVVGTEKATQVIKTGWWIQIDGSTGEVIRSRR